MRIGINLVGGFLGSGKTTLLRRLAQDPTAGSKLAILINELGSSGLDQELVEQEEMSKNLHIKQLSSGCICCTLQGELLNSLQDFIELTQKRGIEKIVIETSGVTNLAELSYSINAIGTKLPIYTESIMTVIDSKNARKTFLEHQELFTEQLRLSDLILLNKQDLVSAVEQEDLLSWILPLCKQATWIWTTQVNIPVPLLLGIGFLRKSSPESKQKDIPHTLISPVPPPHHGLSAIEIENLSAVRKENLIDAVQDLASSVFRIKGIVEILPEEKTTNPPVLTIVQVVGEQIELAPYSYKDKTLTRPRLILIGKTPQRDNIQQTLSKYGLVKNKN